MQNMSEKQDGMTLTGDEIYMNYLHVYWLERRKNGFKFNSQIKFFKFKNSNQNNHTASNGFCTGLSYNLNQYFMLVEGLMFYKI